MSDENSFSLILSCGGYFYGGVTLCSSTTNVIVNFERHFDPSERESIMNFLDHTCGLFDGPMGEWNKITNIVQILHSRYNLINDNFKSALYTWFAQHKRCGGTLRLIFNSELDGYMKNDETL